MGAASGDAVRRMVRALRQAREARGEQDVEHRKKRPFGRQGATIDPVSVADPAENRRPQLVVGQRERGEIGVDVALDVSDVPDRQYPGKETRRPSAAIARADGEGRDGHDSDCPR